MAGAKPSDQEKTQILDLVKQGYNVEELVSRYPHIDGRVISGLHMRHSRKAPAAEAAPISDFSQVPHPPRSSVRLEIPRDPNKTPQQEAAEITGFTPSQAAVHTPQGFKPGYREYFVVKKLDPPGDGVMKTEYPPFGIQELMDRYQAGDYEVQHYREGRLFTTYREKIASKNNGSAFGKIQPEEKKLDSPADTFMRAMDVYHRMHTHGKSEDAQVRAVELQVKAEQTRAKAQVEQAATVGLIDLVKEMGKPKPSGSEGQIERIFQLMQEDRKTLETKVKSEMEMMRERAKLDLEFERERLKGEAAKARADAEERLERERLFMAKLQDLDKDRQELWKTSYDNMVQELRGMQDGLSKELEDKKRWLEEYTSLQRQHTDEIISLKKNLSNGGDSLEMAKIIKDGVVQGVDRIGARLDMLVDGKNIGKVQNPADRRALGGGERSVDQKEAKAVLTKDAIAEVLKEQWFQDLQDEIVRTVKRRKSAQSPVMKPHGTLLAQAFIDQMNTDIGMRKYMHYLCSREWVEVLVDAEPGLKPENLDLMHDPETGVWFIEFQAFLTAAWNASMGVK
jgi:hypothetical protein